MVKSWKARKMVPGKDTIGVMAVHYGLSPSTVIRVIKSAKAEVIREDGFRGVIRMVNRAAGSGTSWLTNGWSDGKFGVDPNTTRLTKSSIMAVSQWAHQNSA